MNSFFDRLEAQLHTAAQAQTAGSWTRLRTRWGWLRSGTRIVPILAALAVTIGVVVVAFTVGSRAHRIGRQTQVVGSNTSTATSNATPTTSSGPPDCNAAGINAQQLREGTCVAGAQTVVVVDKTSTLHLHSLDARYGGFHTNGKLATFTITIKNKLGTPQRWQHTMAALFIPGAYNVATNSAFYLEDLTAETSDQRSCLWKTGTAAHGGLQPGGSVTCDLAFEIPADANPAASGNGLDIANFGEDVSNPSRQPVGTIRTYH